MAKINQNFSNFFAKATAAGYGTNQIVSFLQDVFSNPSAQAEKQRLGKGISEGTLRPDEEAAAHAIHRAEAPERALRKGATLATTAGGIALGATKLPGLIQKGIGMLGGLLNQGKQGQPVSPETEEPQQQEKSHPGGFLEFIKQNPELGSYLDSLMQNGLDPIQAASQAKKHRKFGPLVQSVEKQMGQSFEELMSQLFQGSQNQRSQGQEGQRSAQGNQQSSNDSELIAALQQILKM